MRGSGAGVVEAGIKKGNGKGRQTERLGAGVGGGNVAIIEVTVREAEEG